MKTWKLIAIVALILIIPLVLAFLIFYQTKPTASYERHVEEVMNMEQTDLDSPISGIRTGVYRDVTSLGNNEFECTDDGVYYMADTLPGMYDMTGEGNKKFEGYSDFIFFCPHDSDTMIKLCGRPDCTHDSPKCNAAFFGGVVGGITYYDGHLYVITRFDDPLWMPTLWRMNPDGTERELVLQTSAIVEGENPYMGCRAPYFQNGVFGAGLLYGIEDGYASGCDWVYCKLDGSSPKITMTDWGQGWNDGFAMLCGSQQAPDGTIDGNWHLYQWDPDTDTSEQLVQLPEEIFGYWGADAGYYFENGNVIKVNYPDGNQSVLFETGLTGKYLAQFYPDCIAMLELKDRSPEDPGMMYFYSWEGEKLGEIAIGVNNELGISLFGGESKDRIMLRGGFDTSLPEYYIEKSDFGTGHIELHKFKYPDLDEDTYRQHFGED